MKPIETEIPGVVVFEPLAHHDERGYFMETFRDNLHAQILGVKFVQDNLSFSHRGVLRGLHFQWPQPQGKLVMAAQGAVFDVAVDIRRGSPTFGRWVGVELSSENRRQIYVPEGFAHGFAVLSETALVTYKCTGYYNRETEGTLVWDDPEVGVRWPEGLDFTISEKDRAGTRLSEFAPERLPDRL